jgi:hypothetical protein
MRTSLVAFPGLVRISKLATASLPHPHKGHVQRSDCLPFRLLGPTVVALGGLDVGVAHEPLDK